MRSDAFQTAQIYRLLLKAVKKHIGKEENKRHFIEFVTSEFRNNQNLSDGVAVQQKIKLARDYTFLLNSVHHHKDLLFSYNIAVDRSDEVKRTLGKSASSVGLRLPEVSSQKLNPCSSSPVIFVELQRLGVGCFRMGLYAKLGELHLINAYIDTFWPNLD
ncbi:hypothetical protein CR513_57716 [Mucuna pruriens]|uniref:Uncharacterized protein n=1 Tax=Mucuna pruriens TaxID=157652 RepID=A0A371ECQ0_MUCPR|nr:hypothetical protein CR513_57716 [Mucuna pruriens]